LRIAATVITDVIHVGLGLGGMCVATGAQPHKRFYEKVIKVKADVAALLYVLTSATFPQKSLR
jgi:hypothetical protein